MHTKAKLTYLSLPVWKSLLSPHMSTFLTTNEKWQTPLEEGRCMHSETRRVPTHCHPSIAQWMVLHWVHKSPKQARLENTENIQISSKDQIETVGEAHSLQRTSGCPHRPSFGSTLLSRESWKYVFTGHSVPHWSLLFHQPLLRCSAAQS